MPDYEFSLEWANKTGSLVELNLAVVSSGFKYISAKLLKSAPERNTYALSVRGPEGNLSAFREHVAGHASCISMQDSPGLLNREATSESASKSTGTVGAEADLAKLEAFLPELASSYPKVLGPIGRFAKALPLELRPGTLYASGKRLGAWVFKRDYALGAKFENSDFIKRVVQPVISQMANATAEESTLYLDRTSLSGDEKAYGCRFFTGLMEGLGNEARYLGRVAIVEKECCSQGATRCRFVFQFR